MVNNNYQYKQEHLEKLIHLNNKNECLSVSQQREKLLAEMIKIINSPNLTTNLLEELLKKTAESLEADRVIIYNREEENLQIYQQWQRVTPIPVTLNTDSEKIEQKTENENEIRVGEECSWSNNIINTPIYIGDKIYGQLTILNPKDINKLTMEGKNPLESIADLIGIGIDKYKLLKQLEITTTINAKLAEEKQSMCAANESQEEFFSHMTHDLRSPLAAILGFARLLRDKLFGDLNDKQMQYINAILDSGQLMSELVNNLLDLSKIDANREELFLEKIAVEEICKVALCIVEERAKAQNLEMRLKVSPKINFCYADKLRLKQILVNLLTNAIKFTEQGSVTLQVESKNKMIEFAVIDTGIGIKETDQEKLFQPFTQVSGSLNRKHKGTGLGLTLCRKLARLHGGDITLKSNLGKGSCFTLKLPKEAIKNDN